MVFPFLTKQHPWRRVRGSATAFYSTISKRNRTTAVEVEDLRESIRSKQNDDVAFNIAKHLFSSKETRNSRNIVFSPLSLHVVLSIIAAGSDAPTRDQLLYFLRSKSTDDLNSLASQLVSVVLSGGSPAAGGPKLCSVNGAWVDQGFSIKHSFKHLLNTDYKATLASVDFQTKRLQVTREINLWAEKATNGLIKEILSPGSVKPLTVLIFANALYFKGAWKEKFDAFKTIDDDFHLLDGSSVVNVPFMISRKKQFISVFDGFKVLGLPYRRGDDDMRRFFMYIFLPDAKDGISALAEKIMSSESGFLERKLPYQKVEVGNFRIPRFKFSFGFEASKALKELGVVLPFEGGLTEMVDSPAGPEELYVSGIYQKSFVEVNEVGTEAAAVTCALSVLGSARGFPTKRIDFVADHPFLFMIRENMTGTILFMGQVLNPLDAAKHLVSGREV